MATRKRLGVPTDLCIRPLVAHLGRPSHEAQFDRHVDVPARLALGMRAQRLDAALLTPIDFAREYAGYEIVPGVGVASAQGTGTISLIFREEPLHTVSTVAVDPSSTSEIILAKILLAEEYDVRPQFVPSSGSVADQLERAEAVLLVGDVSLREAERHPNRVDLVEAWVDLVNVPYVHGIWCAQTGTLSTDHLQALVDAAHSGVASLDALAADIAPDQFPPHTHALLADYLHMFSYTLSDDDLEGMREFLRYAFYHGVIPDVPDLTLASLTSPDPDGDGATVR